MNSLTYQAGQSFTKPAGANQEKYRFLKISSGKAVLCGAGEFSRGVSLEDFNEDSACTIYKAGIMPVEIGAGGVTEGAPVVSDANGKAVLASTLTTASGGTTVTSDAATPTLEGSILPERILGVADATASEGDIILIDLK